MKPEKSKSWMPVAGLPDESKPSRLLSVPRTKLGLRIILSVITVLFSLLFLAYIFRMDVDDWRPLPEPDILKLNTGLLVLSSAALQWSKISWERGLFRSVRNGLIAAGLLTVLFLAGQLLAWQQIRSSGYLLKGNPATSFFYLITLIHGLHLIGGLVAWFRTFVQFTRGNALARIRINIELCALYWHFMLAVWLVFYGLMLYT